MNSQTPPKTIRTRAALTLLLAVSGILYLLADRYLIQHVEIADVSIYASAATNAGATPTASLSYETASLSPMVSLSTATSTTSVSFDNWYYQSDTISISIRQVTTGSGRNMVTYFVADAILSNAAQLSSAFANNSFGRNIIASTSEIAAANNAIFAVNGDYYGFRTDGIIIRNGVIYRDEPARTGLAFYLDGSMKIYDETQTTAEQLLAGGVWNTLSFGPALLINAELANGMETYQVDKNLGNHPIQGSQPRTGVGIIDSHHFVFIVVDGRSTGYSKGLTLTEFAQLFKDLGCTDAYNLDGGGSSTMYFMGRVVNNPLGKNKERGTSDILFIAP